MDERPQLPGPATAIAIVSLVLGGIALISSPIALLAIVLGKQLPGGTSSAILNDPLLLRWSIATVSVSMVLAALRVIGGGGLLARRAWCRPVLNVESIGSLAVTVVGTLVNLLVMTPRTLEVMSQDPQNTAIGRAVGVDVARFIAAGSAAGGIISAVFAIGVAVATLVILTRPDVRAALQTRALPAGTPQFPGLPGGP